MNQNQRTIHQKQIRGKYYGIFSFSREPLNIVMWSHYAHKHEGLCIGFDGNKLEDFCNSYLQKNNVNIQLHEVEYVDTFPYLDRANMKDEEFIFKSLITMSNHWEYEKEWRLIALSKDYSNHSVIIDEDIICKVILGCNMSTKNIEDIINLLKGKRFKVSLYRSSIRTDAFGLKFEELEY